MATSGLDSTSQSLYIPMATDKTGAMTGVGSSGSSQPEQTPISAAVSDSAPSSTGAHLRPHYTPQFSATTEMILKRIRGEPTNMSSAISSASASGSIKQSTYEDAKRRLVMSMNTSMTLPMPASSAPTPARENKAHQPQKSSALKVAPGRGRPPKVDKQEKASPRGVKRRRGKDDDVASSRDSDLSETGEDGEFHGSAVPTMTKSGRQVLKPTQFNPTSATGPTKRKHYGKRTPEQALCKVCTRGLSPMNNQIVFCDGCNICWHQLCHDPYIDDEFVSDESRSWFCRSCLAKREKHLAKKRSIGEFKGASWSTKTDGQKRTYLSSLTHPQLVNLVMYSVELHPDLPLFPIAESSTGKRGSRNAIGGAAAGGLSFSPAASPSGPINFSPSITTAGSRSENGKRSNGKGIVDEIEHNARESSVESVPPAWPKVGQGVLAGLDLNEDDFQDKNDFEAFSVATYSATGKKIVENGMPIPGSQAAT